MSALIASLLAEWWPQIAAGLVAIAGLFGIYRKGRSDEKQKAKLEDITNANAIRKAGAAARAGADPDRMHDDGWKRD